jgi:predicted AAA+ superfamily ATPase
LEDLANIAENYLYKDIFAFVELKKTRSFKKILQALAFQIGNKVSFLELANLAKTTISTVKHYIDILEKTCNLG